MPDNRKRNASDGSGDQLSSKIFKAVVPLLEEPLNAVSRGAISGLANYVQRNLMFWPLFPLVNILNQGLKAVADKKNKTGKTIVSESNQDGFILNLPDPVENFTGRESELKKIHTSLKASCGVTAITQSMANLDLKKSKNKGAFSISGLGGVGKTQLALRYALLYAKDYDNNVIWVDAENPSDSFKKLAGNSRINIKIKDINDCDKADNDIAREVYDHFKGRKSLFIFDNVENLKELKNFLPKQGHKPHILITSRYQDWEGIAEKISLNVFNDKEAENFIKKALNIVTIEDITELVNKLEDEPEGFKVIITKKDIRENIEKFKGKIKEFDKASEALEKLLSQDEGGCYILDKSSKLAEKLEGLLQRSKEDRNIVDNDTIVELNQTLQGLPLALQQAVAYIKQQKILDSSYGIKDYLKEYNESYGKTEKLLNLNLNLNKYNGDPYMKTVMTTWKVTWNKIEKDEEVGKEAMRILNIMAYLTPDDICSKMFLKLGIDKDKLINAIDLLRNYSMINKGSKPNLSNIHRLVQEVMCIRLRKQNKEEQVLVDVLIILREEMKHTKLNTKSFKTDHALLVCVRASRYSQLHQAVDLLLKLSGKGESTKSVLQYIIDRKKGGMQYVLENMQGQWKQEERFLLVELLLKGLKKNKRYVVNSFKGELQSLMSDPSIFKLLVNASLSNGVDNLNLTGRIMNRSLGLDIKLEEEIVIEKYFDGIKARFVIEKGTDISEVRKFFSTFKSNMLQYFNHYPGQKIYNFQLSPNISTSRKLYPKVKDDIKYLRKREVVSHMQVSGSSHHEMRLVDNRFSYSSPGALSLDLRQTIPLMDNYSCSINYGITPTNLLARYPQAVSHTQVSGDSHHEMRLIGNCFPYYSPEVLGSHSRQIPIFMGNYSYSFNPMYFQEKEVVSYMQTSGGSRQGMHFVDNHFSDPNSETLSSNSNQILISERHEPMGENSCSSDSESFEEFTSDEIKDASSSPSSVMEVNSVSCTRSNGPYSKIWRPF